jgi:hypothetical protein
MLRNPSKAILTRWCIPLLILLAAVIGANLLGLFLAPNGYTLDVGTRRDRALLNGVHGPERDALGTTYRWTAGDTAIRLFTPRAPGPLVLNFSLGWLPPDAELPRTIALALGDQPWVELAAPNEPRHYAFLVPPDQPQRGRITLNVSSPTSVIPPDERPLGVRLDSLSIRWNPAAVALPTAGAIAAQWGLAALWLALGRLLRLRRAVIAIGALALVIGLAVMSAVLMPLAPLWQQRLLVAGLGIAGVIGAAWRIVPRVEPAASERFVRLLLLITLGALAVRCFGVLYPSFVSHDMLVNSGRLRNVQFGILTLFDRPSEFSRYIVPVSPTAFVLTLPFTLIADRPLAMYSAYSLFDGLTPLLVGLLALRMGLKERGALVAAALIAFLPMYLTALYWGFVKQIIGQWLTLLSFLVIAYGPPQRRMGWVLIGTLWVVNFLIHPGGLLLSGVALGLFVLFGLVSAHTAAQPQPLGIVSGAERRMLPGRNWLAGAHMAPWRGWLATLIGASVVALLIQYIDAAILTIGGRISGITSADSTNQLTDQSALLAQIWVGLNASFAPLPLALAVIGIAVVCWRSRGPQRLLALAWTASALLFLLVDVITAQQVRYGYFIAPLVCCGVAWIGEPLLRYRLGRWAVWGLVALVWLAGLMLWLDATLAGVRPSVNSLTH